MTPAAGPSAATDAGRLQAALPGLLGTSPRARTEPPAFAQAKAVRAAPPPPRARPVPGIRSSARRELPCGVHLHIHRVYAENVAEILRAHDPPMRNDPGQ
jgi:hypothetical protein